MRFNWFGKKESKNPSDYNIDSRTLIAMGEDLISNRNFQDAIRCFEQALKLDPTNDLAWGAKALTLDYLKRYEEALQCYDRALECNPNNAVTWHNRGLTLASLKRLTESVESFGKATEINPRYAKAWYNKGRLLSKMGDDQGSQHCLDMARKLDPLLFMKLRGR